VAFSFQAVMFYLYPNKKTTPMTTETHLTAEDVRNIINREIQKEFASLVAIRRTLHEHPELSGEEIKTAALVATELERLGLAVQRNVAGHGVVGVLRGGRATATSKVVALRADMDALPLPEETKHNFPSQVPNVMHACGHDAHTASLIGAARVLASIKNELAGTVKFIFQPSEEVVPGGAKPMLDAGVFDNPKVDVVFGEHVMTAIPVGKAGFFNGAIMASADEIYITVKGIGGHASTPHKAIDPIVISAYIITALQTLISRSTNPFEQSVVTIGSIHGGTATNIIPNEVKIEGTFRAMNETVRFDLHKKMRTIVEGTALALGGTAELEIRIGYPATINDSSITQFAMTAAAELLGKDNVIQAEPSMGAEDFGYYLQAAAGTFWRLGIRNEAIDAVHAIHSTHFDLDENSMKVGAGLFAYLTWKYLNDAGK
jgi:amidohydrolase